MQLGGLVLGCSVLVPLRSRLLSLLIASSVKLERERGEKERSPLHPALAGPSAGPVSSTSYIYIGDHYILHAGDPQQSAVSLN